MISAKQKEQKVQSKMENVIILRQQNVQSGMLTGSSVDSQRQSKGNPSALNINLKNRHAIKPIIYVLFKLLSFVINFNYSVENALITMVMITFLTPNIVDSLIWIIPNIISILIRPYLIRYIHKVNRSHRMRSEALLVNFFLFLGAVGAFIIAQSTLMNQSKKGFHGFRILVCSIGWTFTGTSFQLCEYFIDKLKESIQEQCYMKKQALIVDKKEKKDSQTNEESQQFAFINFEELDSPNSLLSNYKFLGSLCGYLLVLLLFVLSFRSKLKIKTFFESVNIVYTITGFLTLLCSIVFYIIIFYSAFPKPDPELKPKSIPFKISYSLNYYLPGLAEFKFLSTREISFLVVHFIVNFVLDVMFIYTTMWTTGSQETDGMKEGQANFYGVRYGVFYLIVFTIVYYSNLVPSIIVKSILSLNFLAVLSSILFFISFWFNYSLLYLPLITVLAILLKAYENHVESQLEEIKPEIKISKEFVVRMQKIAVLNVLPFVIMILLDRDDIQDCLLWCAVMLLIIAFLLTYTKAQQHYQLILQEEEEKNKKE